MFAAKEKQVVGLSLRFGPNGLCRRLACPGPEESMRYGDLSCPCPRGQASRDPPTPPSSLWVERGCPRESGMPLLFVAAGQNYCSTSPNPKEVFLWVILCNRDQSANL